MKLISIIVISYNRPDDALELLQNLVQQKNVSEIVSEVIILNNASHVSYNKVEEFCTTQTKVSFKYYNPGVNLGVAKGRNFAIKHSTAPILLLLDDDAILENSDALEHVQKCFEKEKFDSIGALACKVLYYENKLIQKTAFPHKQFEQYKNKDHFETYYFAGCAHALSREALQKIGLFPEDFFYGMEEYDLSFRLLDAGYKIVYTSGVTLLHKESPLGRSPKAEKLRMMWVNKSKVAWRYLKIQHFITTSVIWAFYMLVKSKGAWGELYKGIKLIIETIFKERRKPLKPRTFEYLYSLKPRLWY